MARPERFELPTDRFEADYSIQLSYERYIYSLLSKSDSGKIATITANPYRCKLLPDLKRYTGCD